MPRLSNIVSIFLASPSDVSAERAVVTRAISQWNSIRARDRGVTFELIKWETSTSAGIGLDGQDVVNSQTPTFDAMIGLFWTKIGQQTERAVSGSVEEYEHVLDRHKSGEAVDIGMYFKNVPAPLDKVDPKQLQGVFDLKERLQADGVYYKSFTDDTGLDFEISIFLDRLAKRFQDPAGLSGESGDLSNVATNHDSLHKPQNGLDSDALGYFDLLEDLEKFSEHGNAFLSGMGVHFDEITEVVASSGNRFEELGALGPVGPADAKAVIADIVRAFDNFSSYIEEGIDEYAISSSGIAETSRSLIDVAADFKVKDEDAAEGIETLETFVNAMTGAIESMESFTSTVSALQRMTVKFNQSKRRMVNNIVRFTDLVKSTRSIVNDTLLALRSQP